ncbi:MAG: DUF3098 domain-containing protein [Bacteroidota bacterium]|jgi:mannitol-specific phosphotransferase system IIBC component|nr:DUF3098 domain-containing protein [Bacteroidota bacterium]NLP20236.1 DUF3098 domain-containing protein [Bacteroidales bacterium]OQC43987.1 MAG: hypothetical protein BWX59_02169 [Bacteroidetes bacterium ADurb.Bin028]HNY44801.1 DUF3098 domain-containing protein [Bacteroidales bacterium]HOD88224.1 DUF3098 domain-containing protein [Bacteroidales bacterium]
MNKIEKTENQEQNSGFTLGKKNYILIIIGFALIILGFILMSGGKSTDPNVFNEEIFNFRRISLAPIIILIGFIIEIFAILWRPKSK